MFLGHYGVALAAKKAAPKVSLAWLFAAAQFADILWPILLVTNVEQYALQPGYSKVSAYNFISYPWSHSLLMDLVWAVLAGSLYSFFFKDRQGGLTIGLLVLSHWFLDLVVHVPDLPLSPFNLLKVGLSGWNSISATLIVELACFLGGLAIYLTSTRPRKRLGSWLLWTLVILLLALFFNTTFSKPEDLPLMTLFIVFMTLMAVLLFLAWLTDRNRSSVS